MPEQQQEKPACSGDCVIQTVLTEGICKEEFLAFDSCFDAAHAKGGDEEACTPLGVCGRPQQTLMAYCACITDVWKKLTVTCLPVSPAVQFDKFRACMKTKSAITNAVQQVIGN